MKAAVDRRPQRIKKRENNFNRPETRLKWPAYMILDMRVL